MNTGTGKNLANGGLTTRAPTPTPTVFTAQPTRHSSQNICLTKDEIASQEKEVKDANNGAAYLEKTLLCLVGQPFTIEHLATILLHIMQIKSIPLPAIEAIRAVAFLLEHKAITQTANAVAAQLREDLSDQVAH
ncbi:hypothetical protein JVT61DRAFT_1685 [Boletus reticuloceps]|uniref:Uncharacterized protein n=1 Tax=Boletus reticuloceps TaxID=495285 RepID=A0A8I2YTH4_9AGAM|nr:hypothetical protein JVT61DRAFT_1685 [Boletus reticuloceps]